MKYKDSYVDLSHRSNHQMKCVRATLFKMCKITQNRINDRTAKRSNAREKEQHDIFSHNQM